MKKFKLTAKIFYGLGIVGLGILHFFYAGFRPVILPIPPETTQHLSLLVYLTGAFLCVTGIAIVVSKNVKAVALWLGIVLLLFFILGHLYNRVTNQPTNIGAWTDALKLLSLSGGAFIVAKVFSNVDQSRLTASLSRISFLGKYFFGIMLIVFGIDHFIYLEFVKTLVPLWIPGNVFWTYVAGVALIGSGLAIVINFQRKLISILLGTMLFLWLIFLHIPRAVTMNTPSDPNEIVSVLECLAFSGMAFLLYFDDKK